MKASDRITALEDKARPLILALPGAYRLIVGPLVAELIATLRELAKERQDGR